MSQIDWSKAPEDYPVWAEALGGAFGTGWHKDAGDRWINEEGCYWLKEAETRGKVRIHRAPWRGAGLPPVGTVCECQDSSLRWKRGVIVHVGADRGMNIAVMQCDDEILWGERGEFRPIRTPEQIAADDREAAVREMHRTIAESDRYLVSELEALYDAGYRKP